jgi:hypothetical protein
MLQADCISTLYPGLQQPSVVKWNGSITNIPPPPPLPWTDGPKPHHLIHLFHSALRSGKNNYTFIRAYGLHIQLLFWSDVSLHCSTGRYLRTMTHCSVPTPTTHVHITTLTLQRSEPTDTTRLSCTFARLVWRSGGTAPCILSFRNECWWMVSRFIPRRRSPALGG